VKIEAPAEIVRAELQHCQYLYELYARPDVMEGHGLRLPVPAPDWRRIIQGVWDGWKDVWIVRQGEIAVGHVGLHDRSDPDRRTDLTVAIDPSRQGRGLGRQALALALAFCDGSGIGTVIVRFPFYNARARALFEGGGFREAGRIPRFYRTAEGIFSQIIMVRTIGDADAKADATAPARRRMAGRRTSKATKVKVRRKTVR
jgi:RimJ/RimL family protein N-acetyltransferase